MVFDSQMLNNVLIARNRGQLIDNLFFSAVVQYINCLCFLTNDTVDILLCLLRCTGASYVVACIGRS